MCHKKVEQACTLIWGCNGGLTKSIAAPKGIFDMNTVMNFLTRSLVIVTLIMGVYVMGAVVRSVISPNDVQAATTDCDANWKCHLPDCGSWPSDPTLCGVCASFPGPLTDQGCMYVPEYGGSHLRCREYNCTDDMQPT